MSAYSSTGLKTYSNNCPHALTLMEQGTPKDNDFYQAGIAAHAVLQMVGEKGATEPEDVVRVAQATVREILEHGREYNGVHEPPMSPEAAFEGRDLALAWLEFNPLPEGARFELGMGIDKDGNPCGYNDENVRYRGILDIMYTDIVGDEDYSVEAAVVGDYKSAWPTNADELNTLQRKGQTVLVHAHLPEYDAIRREVCNLRTGMTYDDTIHLDDQGMASIEGWRHDILMLCDVADQSREARPGAGCLTCSYTLSCDYCLEAYSGNGVDEAVQYVALEAVRNALVSVLKDKTRHKPIDVPGGFVGYRKQDKQKPVADAHRKLTELWTIDDTEDHPEMRGCLAATKLTKANIENALKIVFPGRDNYEARQAAMEDMLSPITESRFGAYTER